MGIQFTPRNCRPISLKENTTGACWGPIRKPVAAGTRERRWPSGWWILPAIILGLAEVIGIVGWIVA